MVIQFAAARAVAPAVVEETRNPFASMNFRLWWSASIISGAGVGIQTVIVPLFIRDRVSLDHRAAAIGLELIAANLVGALLALVGGVAADRIWASIVASLWGPRPTVLVGAVACMALGAGCVLFLKPVRRLA